MKPRTHRDGAREEFLAKWRGEADAMRRRNVMVTGALLCDEVLRDIETLFATEKEAVLTLEEAAAESGYSVDHLARLVRTGRIPDTRPPGSKGRIHVRAADLPARPCRRHTKSADVHELASRLYGGREGPSGHP